MAKKVYKRYSEAFRIQVVREYEQDGMSVNALRKKYGVSHVTLQRWIQRYSSPGLRYETMTIQTPKERNRLKALEAENAQLKQLVADLTMENRILESTVAVIEQDYGIDVKKNALISSNGRRP